MQYGRWWYCEGWGVVTVKVSERDLWPSVLDAVAPRGRLTFVPPALIVRWVLETVTQGRLPRLGSGCLGSGTSAWATGAITAPTAPPADVSTQTMSLPTSLDEWRKRKDSSSCRFLLLPSGAGHSQSPASVWTPPSATVNFLFSLFKNCIHVSDLYLLEPTPPSLWSTRLFILVTAVTRMNLVGTNEVQHVNQPLFAKRKLNSLNLWQGNGSCGNSKTCHFRYVIISWFENWTSTSCSTRLWAGSGQTQLVSLFLKVTPAASDVFLPPLSGILSSAVIALSLAHSLVHSLPLCSQPSVIWGCEFNGRCLTLID